MAQAQVQFGRAERPSVNTKLWVCGVSLAVVFMGWLVFGRDPSQLEIVVPSIILAYCGARAYTDGQVIKAQTNGTDTSGGNGGR